MAGLEAIGEAVTGGLAARAVEPKAGEGGRHGDEAACLNCGTALVGEFCHACGQKGHVHRTISAWWHDFLHGVLHLDGKFWRTMPMLAFRPGILTRRYAEGQRATFISPMALFLFSVFLMFAVFSAVGGFDTGVARGFEQEIATADADIARLEARRTTRQAEGRDTAQLDARIARLRSERESLAQGEQMVREGEFIGDIDTGIPALDSAFRKAKANPALLIYKLQANAYKFSWALIPISVPFVWLLFLHRRRYRAFHGYDHVVFVTYSIAFMSLLMIALVALNAAGVSGTVTGLAFTFIPPLHIYKQLRGAYALSRFSALWRTMLLLAFASLALTLFVLLLLTIGVFG
jgi:hypothetical protein